jgi:hypothetical protein
MSQSTDSFVRRQNIERYRRLLERVSEDADRQKILHLLSREQENQNGSGETTVKT